MVLGNGTRLQGLQKYLKQKYLILFVGIKLSIAPTQVTWRKNSSHIAEKK